MFWRQDMWVTAIQKRETEAMMPLRPPWWILYQRWIFLQMMLWELLVRNSFWKARRAIAKIPSNLACLCAQRPSVAF
ncbi:hypothetical protein OIU76_008945 [Salix suchowensis]|nr:hypothetical protein OIU76_008945 [Salix suchowensis]KAJ6330226.1 hypothetical protein OIU76_008945 [Salix suchowensis]